MEIHTDYETDGCTFQWKIENISHCWLKHYQEIDSPAFIADAVKRTKWFLRLYPKGGLDESEVLFFLRRANDCTGPYVVEVNYQLAFLGKDGSTLQELNGSENRFKKDEYGCFSKNELRERIFDTEREDFLPQDTLTVQCTLWKKGQIPVKSHKLYARTVFKVNRRSFLCRIENFSTLVSGQKSKFSDSFIDFDLVLNVGLDFEKKVALQVISCDENAKYFSFKTFIIDSKGKKESCGTHEYLDGDWKKGILFTLFLTRKIEENKSLYLPNDVLSLDCEYVCSDGTVLYEYCGFGIIFPKLGNENIASKNEKNIRKEECPSTSDLAYDLKIMYNDAICSNTVLRTPIHEFPAHKGILSARSPVFRSMFSNDMKEKNSGHVDIADFEDDTIHRMLLYVYTDSLEDLHFENASSLYRIADKYQILSLRNKCSSFLKGSLCLSNACNLLILADLHNDDDLKRAAEDYILGKRKIIFCSQVWKDFMNNHLKLAADLMYRKIYEE